MRRCTKTRGSGRLTNGDHRSTTESKLARAHVPARNRGRLIDYAETFQEHDFPPDESDDGISRGEVGLQPAGALPRRACARAGHRRSRPLCCLSAMRIYLPAPRDQNYSRRNFKERSFRQGGKIPGRIRYRHGALHFLRHVRGSLPEQAIYLRKDYAMTGFTREDMMHHKDKLLEIGGV